MLNAEMILKKGIKPEDLYFVTTSDDDDEFDFKGTKWAIYEQKDDTRVGGLTIPASASNEFHGKIIEPIAIWLCCDTAFAVYTPTKNTKFTNSVFCYDTDHKRFQCKRMASLFKAEYSDGCRTYSDIDRCRCKTVVGNSYYCYPKESIEINNKLVPITMPYFPKDRYVFLVDEIEPEP